MLCSFDKIRDCINYLNDFISRYNSDDLSYFYDKGDYLDLEWLEIRLLEACHLVDKIDDFFEVKIDE